jgi:hypothetical protein
MTPMMISKSPTMTRPFSNYRDYEQAYADSDKDQTVTGGARSIGA